MATHKKRKIGITDTTLRDGHQSLWATRLSTPEMLPIAKKIDNIGYHSVEVWGGASFDSCLRFLNEDPWERLSILRKAMPNTRFQALFRGQNLVGYKHYPDDIVEAFVKKAVDMGIDIIRVFDALNDTRNTESTFRAARKKKNVHIQAAVSYTISPIHNNDYFVGVAKRFAELGADSICLKDMAGLLAPGDAFSLITDIKKAVNLPIQLHSHYVSGMAAMSYYKAIEAGADVIDTAISPLAMTSSQPATETMVYALQGQYDTGIDIDALLEIAEYFQQLAPKFMNMSMQNRIDTEVLSHQVPGGMISNLYSQLEQQKAAHRLHDVLTELPKVREDFGYPPLVTPTSQILGTQAVLNVLIGQRYKVVPAEVKAYIKGLYGKPPSEINPAVKALILGDEEAITCRPADLLEPGLKKAKAEIADMSKKDTDILSYAVFPQVWLQYYNAKNAAPAEAKGEENTFKDIRMMLSGLASK
jgi:oxaloacetate decarboxylase alpha subunit